MYSRCWCWRLERSTSWIGAIWISRGFTFCIRHKLSLSHASSRTPGYGASTRLRWIAHGHHLRPNYRTYLHHQPQGLPQASASYPLQGFRDRQNAGFPDQQLHLADRNYLRVLQGAFAGGTVLQVDQSVFAHQEIPRYIRKCGEVANLDRRVGLCPRRPNQKAPQSGCIAGLKVAVHKTAFLQEARQTYQIPCCWVQLQRGARSVTYCRAAICHIPKCIFSLYNPFSILIFNSSIKETGMFTKLRESELFKLLLAAFCFDRKGKENKYSSTRLTNMDSQKMGIARDRSAPDAVWNRSKSKKYHRNSAISS